MAGPAPVRDRRTRGQRDVAGIPVGHLDGRRDQGHGHRARAPPGRQLYRGLRRAPQLVRWAAAHVRVRAPADLVHRVGRGHLQVPRHGVADAPVRRHGPRPSRRRRHRRPRPGGTRSPRCGRGVRDLPGRHAQRRRDRTHGVPSRDRAHRVAYGGGDRPGRARRDEVVVSRPADRTADPATDDRHRPGRSGPGAGSGHDCRTRRRQGGVGGPGRR